MSEQHRAPESNYEQGLYEAPFEIWRQLYDANRHFWSTTVGDAVSLQNEALAPGRVLEGMLGFQQIVRATMNAPLAALNVPTSQEVRLVGDTVEAVKRDLVGLGTMASGLRADVARQSDAHSQARGEVTRLGELVVALTMSIDKLSQRVAVVEERVRESASLEKRIANTEQRVAALSGDLDKKVAHVEKGITGLDGALSVIRNSVDKLAKQLTGLKEPLGGIDKGVGQLDKRLAGIEKQLASSQAKPEGKAARKVKSVSTESATQRAAGAGD